ncbi:alpha/beta fold hydrolase [Pseudomonas synxantha]|uniref:alpha/beta fold hydrolase n=1 Tax=Pseudomonas synxantha TaxID=47883 RepID=UPI001F149CB4|nr:alpha/beta fold hydrolase [Pseudomonas synxantha]
MSMNNYECTRVECGGLSLVARIYHAGSQRQAPILILCHGFCGTQDILLPASARGFAMAAYSAVTFDYRGFGESEGERGRLQPKLQIEDIQTVINWAKQQKN